MSRVPPYDERAERSVLGGVLVSNKLLDRLGSQMKAEYFYLPRHRRIFEAMLDLRRDGLAIDPVTLSERLEKAGHLDMVGGSEYLGTLLDSPVVAAGAGSHVRILRERYAVREMIRVSQEITARGYGMPPDVDSYLSDSRTDVADVSAAMHASAGAKPIRSELEKVYAELMDGVEPSGLIKTGISDLDLTTGGLWPGIVTVLAGRPAMGKSLFALNVAVNAAEQGKKVLYYSLEDTNRSVVLRALARYGDHDLQKLALGDVEPAKRGRLLEAAEKIHDLTLWLEDSGDLTGDRIRQSAALHAETHGLDLVIVDHLQQLNDGGERLFEAMTRAARSMSATAKELGVPMLLLSQLSRRVEERENKRPLLSDLRQTGEIEQQARAVWFLYRPAYYKPDDSDQNELELIVAKQSHGKTGILKLWIDLAKMFVADRSTWGGEGRPVGPLDYDAADWFKEQESKNGG